MPCLLPLCDLNEEPDPVIIMKQVVASDYFVQEAAKGPNVRRRSSPLPFPPVIKFGLFFAGICHQQHLRALDEFSPPIPACKVTILCFMLPSFMQKQALGGMLQSHRIVVSASRSEKILLSPKSARSTLKGGWQVRGDQKSCSLQPATGSNKMLSPLMSKWTTFAARISCDICRDTLNRGWQLDDWVKEGCPSCRICGNY